MTWKPPPLPRDYEDPEVREELVQEHILPMAELLKFAEQETPFLVKNAFPAKAITQVVGPPGGGKTWLVALLTMCVARGEPWFSYDAPDKAPVIYFSYDTPTAGLARRYRGMGATTEPIYTHTLKETNALLVLPQDYDAMRAIISKLNPRLIVVDTFRDLHLLDENASADMSQIMKQVRSFTKFGAAVVMIHHTRKDGTISRGSTVIDGGADAIIKVEKRDGSAEGLSLHRAEWTKTRDWAGEHQRLEFRVRDDGPMIRVEEDT